MQNSMCCSLWKVKGHHLEQLTHAVLRRFHCSLTTSHQTLLRAVFLHHHIRTSLCAPGLSAGRVESVCPPTEESRSVAVCRWAYRSEESVCAHQYQPVDKWIKRLKGCRHKLLSLSVCWTWSFSAGVWDQRALGVWQQRQVLQEPLRAAQGRLHHQDQDTRRAQRALSW